MTGAEDIRAAVIPLVTSLTAVLDMATEGLGDGSSEGQYRALANIVTEVRGTLREHEESVEEGLLEDADGLGLA